MISRNSIGWPGLRGAHAPACLAGAAGGDVASLTGGKGGGASCSARAATSAIGPFHHASRSSVGGQLRRGGVPVTHRGQMFAAAWSRACGVEAFARLEPLELDHLRQRWPQLAARDRRRRASIASTSAPCMAMPISAARSLSTPVADAARKPADEDREQRPEQEEDDAAAEQDGAEVAPRHDRSRAPDRQAAGRVARALIARPLLRLRAPWRRASPAIATKASCSPARSIESERMPASPSISARSSGSMPLSGSEKFQ